MSDALARERDHQDAWYRRAIAERFFEREGFRRLIDWNLACLRRAVELRPHTRVLSLGCGTGEYEIILAREVGHVLAVDLSAVAIAEARRRAAALALTNLEFLQASTADLRLPQDGFDVVYALGVLHHLPAVERTELLHRVIQWLAPGGVFYARDPNARGLLRRATAWWLRRSSFHSPNEDALNPHTCRGELLAAGLREPAIGFTDVLLGPLPWLVASSSPVLWASVSAFDRAWLATPGLRGLASQFDIRAGR
jgi:SAM-dependent methyltransferase